MNRVMIKMCEQSRYPRHGESTNALLVAMCFNDVTSPRRGWAKGWPRLLTHFGLCARPQLGCGHRCDAVRYSNFAYYRNKNFFGACRSRNPSVRCIRTCGARSDEFTTEWGVCSPSERGRWRLLNFTSPWKLKNTILLIVKTIQLGDLP